MSEWQLVDKWKNKRQGQVWRVRKANGDEGFFKFAYKEQWYDAGPIVGNEWLTQQLAKRVDLPCANVERTTLRHEGDTLHGIVSLPKSVAGLCSWSDLPESIRQYPERHVHRIDRLIGTIAFDVWLTNIDRGSGHNIILYPGTEGKFHWYLIDHGYALYGCDRKWRNHSPDSPYWRKTWLYYHIPKGWKRLATRARLQALARQIGRIPDPFIERLVAQVPDPLYTPALKRTTTRLLLKRKQALPALLDEWIRYPGNKESSI